MIDLIIKFLGGYTQEEYNKMRSERNIAINSFEMVFQSQRMKILK